MINEMMSNEKNHEAVGLLMTYRCNFNCKYCYVKTKRNVDMSLSMAQRILEPLLNKNDGLLDITFVGGETLLAVDVIKQLVEWVECGNWKKQYRFFGSTNGTLLNDDLKRWIEPRKDVFTLALSYDGIPSVQELNRGNLPIDIDYFIKTWPKQPIQMTINSNAVNDMAKGGIYLLEKGGTVHPNVAFEEYEWNPADIIEYGNQLDMLADYYDKHENLPLITQFQHNILAYAKCITKHQPQSQVCGAGHGYEVYDVDGVGYPCHMLSPLVVKEDRLEPIRKGLVQETTDFSDSRCADCPYTSNCPTCIGCNFIYRNSLQERDLTHCRIMRTEVRSYLKKELKRLKAKTNLTSEDATVIDAIKLIYEYESTHPLF